MTTLWRWLIGTRADLDTVRPWNGVIAEHHAAATERLLLGDCGSARVIGHRRDGAIVASESDGSPSSAAAAHGQAE